MSLAITEIFILRYDYHHQVRQICPKKFGKSTVYSIRKYLRCMLLSKTIQEWDETYSQDIKVLAGDPDSVSIVIVICQNPSYHAEYFFKIIEGNMIVLGSAIADKNHSINVAIIGKGSSMSVVEFFSVLFSKINMLQGIIGKHAMHDILVQLLYTSYHGGKKEWMILLQKYI